MDLIYSPINNISNENENLIIQSEPDEQQNANTVQYLTKKDKSSDVNERIVIKFSFCRWLLIIFLLPEIIIIFISL
jgi:hypothetical protein